MAFSLLSLLLVLLHSSSMQTLSVATRKLDSAAAAAYGGGENDAGCGAGNGSGLGGL